MARKYLITGDPTIPATVEEWNQHRAAVKPPSKSEVTERALRAVITQFNGEATDLLKARTNEESVHGLIVIDQTKLAEKVAAKIEEMGFEPIGNLGDVYKTINRMIGKRYPDLSRAKRRKAAQVLIQHVGGGNPGHEPSAQANPAE